MQISIVAQAPASAGQFLCRFYALAGPLHATPSPCDAQAKTGKHADWLCAEDGVVCLGQNAKALKWHEPAEQLRIMGGVAVRRALHNGAKQTVWVLDGTVSDEDFGLLVQGALLASYRFDACKGKTEPSSLTRLTIVAGGQANRFRKRMQDLAALNTGLSTTRDLANAPANELPPMAMAARAQDVCKAHGLVFKQLKADQLNRDGYVGLTQVGIGSANPPVLFTMEYRPAKTAASARPLCLVGKGITFDTGGISIKPWEGMWDMKADMSGAACVVGAMQAIALLAPAVPVIGVVAAAENMPDGKAYRPGDVLRFRNGRTVEIRSTDAEGRLVLADALIYAQEKLGQKRIVDFATLTGACARALGNPFIGLMSRNAGFAAEVAEAGRAGGDATWELPLALEYRPLIESSVADIMNSGGALAGAQTAGWFLQEFIQPGTEYVHLDIAGTFMASKAEKYFGQPGATGTGVRLAVELARRSA